jgi:GntR family transcriptional repressor for pyruvate dehydrogenase complex
MSHIFKEVRVEKVSDKIADQLELLIKEGKLGPGDKLPSERELINILGVGRSSLREALNKLETLGYVEIKKRKGIFVKSINSSLQLDPLKKMMQEDLHKIVQLYEVRGDIEQANAHAAALKRNEKDLDEIQKCLKDFESQKGIFHFSWERDQAFHCAIARASHNFFRIHVIMNIFDFTKEFIQPIIEGFANTKNNLSIITQQHVSIFKAIEEKDADGARQKMKEHLAWTNKIFLDNFQRFSHSLDSPEN